MVDIKKSFFKAGQKFDTAIKGSKKNYDDDYNALESEFDVVRKSYAELKECMEKYLEPRNSKKNRLEPKKRESKEDPCIESLVAKNLNKTALNMKGMNVYIIKTFADLFDQLVDCKKIFENHYIELTRNSLKENLEIPAEEIKNSAKKVENFRIESIAVKSDKKSTEIMIQEAEYSFKEAKINRTNQLIAYNQNNEDIYVNIVYGYVKTMQEYHANVASITEKFTREYEKLQKQIENKPKIQKFEIGKESYPNHMSNDYWELTDQPTESAPNISQTPTTSKPVFSLRSENTASEQYAIGLFDFDAESPDELDFKTGDKIIILERIDENWYNAEMNGKKGFIPASYIKLVTK